MAAVVTLSHDYAASPDDVWRVATDWECLQAAMKGLVTYHGLPNIGLAQGQVIETTFSLLGVLPRQPWTMEIVEYDPALRRVRSHEFGGAVKAWDHRLTVSPIEGGARLDDRIEIDAGASTQIYAAWARFMYRRRHKPRLKMLGLVA